MPTIDPQAPPAPDDLIARAFADADRWGPEPDAPTAPFAVPAGYQVLRELHRGGQGIVYEALQCSTRRRVAIKVMHAAARTREGQTRRFEREAALLTQLRHPNVVSVYDAGVTAGACYIVMDFIDGQPIDRFAADTRMEPRERLRLFATTCDAVHAAHVRGVIHRDLKPANILVRHTGDGAEPVVLDFGLAKQDGAPPDADVTITGEFVGSLPWASPEQAAGDPARIDTRTDVYSLGVILYQLLTGRFPYEVNGPLRDVLNRIATADPAPLAATHARGTRRLDDDLSTIVLRCLKKDPAQRYQLAGEVGADIRRYLAGEAIEAKRDSAPYVLRKSLRRHRAVLIGAGAMATLLCTATAVSTRLWIRAEQQSDLARREKAIAERSADVMEDLIASAGPWISRGRDTTLLRELLDATLTRIREREYTTAPGVELRLRLALGSVYPQVGAFEEAHELLDPTPALAMALDPPDRPRLASAYARLGELLWWEHRWDESLAFHQAALDVLRTDHPGDHRAVAAALRKVGMGFFQLAQYQKSLEMSQAAREMLERLEETDNDEYVSAVNDVGCSLMYLGRLSDALPHFEAALKSRRAMFDTDQPNLAISLRNLADCRLKLGKPAEALPDMQEAAAMFSRLFGSDHFFTGLRLHELGTCLEALGRNQDALDRYRAALAIFEKRPEKNQQLILDARTRCARLSASQSQDPP